MQFVADTGVGAVGELELLDRLLHQLVLVRLRNSQKRKSATAVVVCTQYNSASTFDTGVCGHEVVVI